jgi:hypothetical protein
MMVREKTEMIHFAASRVRGGATPSDSLGDLTQNDLIYCHGMEPDLNVRVPQG